jgi:predicted acetyltransferase
MELELRAVHDDERDQFLAAVRTGFGMTATPDDDEYPTHLLTRDRSLAVFDGEAIVATAASLPFRVTLPGGAPLPVGAVTDVTVHPTHRRRGLLRRIMARQLDDIAHRGEPVAALTASEASIYERFGYGTATWTTRWELASEYAHLAHSPDGAGSFRLVDAAEGSAIAHAVYRRAAATRVGEIERPEQWWSKIFRPGTGGHRFFTAVHDDADGRPDAFARYAVDHRWPDALPGDVLRVIEVQAVDTEAEAAMWSYLFGIDLVATIVGDDRPVDDPLRWRLPDARRMRVRQLRDHLWLRVLDVAATFSARTYAAEDALTLELHDEVRPANGGRWLVDGGPGGATCVRTDRAADLALGAPELAALLLGGVAPSTLAAAGRVRELTTDGLARADGFFLVHPAPWCTTHF